jgi:hypothetical protein
MRNLFTLICIVFLSLCGYSSVAQEQDKVPTGPTSATDGKVRVHGGKIFHRHHNLAKKLGGDLSGTEHEGKAFHKSKRTTRKMAGEARVFKRHNHFASRERTRSKGTRRH